jgi:hypothetical protein
MTFDFWKNTHTIRPFQSVEEFEQYEEDCIKIPKINIFVNTALNKSRVKKGVNSRSEHFDSFFEFTFVEYMRTLKGHNVERNAKMHSLPYIDHTGKSRKFFPDFIVDGTFYEIKGRFTETDRCKFDQHPEVKWIFAADIELMRIELDSQLPDWKNEFVQLN